MIPLGQVAHQSYDLPGHEDAPGSRPLKNSRHERLAREYAAGASKAEAWRVAHGREPANASRTFRRSDIQARVEFLRSEFTRQAGISLAALQLRLLRIADANLASDFFLSDDSGRLKLRTDLPTMPRAITAPITELQIDKDGAVKIKTADKLHAIDSLIKTIGGFVPENSDGAKGTTLEDLVRASMEKSDTKIALQVVTGVPRAPDQPPDDEPIGATNSAAVRPRVRRLEF
jgi:hypothetical protein